MPQFMDQENQLWIQSSSQLLLWLTELATPMANANGPERAKVGRTGFQEGTRLCKGTRKQEQQHNIKGKAFQTFDGS